MSGVLNPDKVNTLFYVLGIFIDHSIIKIQYNEQFEHVEDNNNQRSTIKLKLFSLMYQDIFCFEVLNLELTDFLLMKIM